MPLVSIIIPVYNVEKYLRQCLDSVVKQTLKDIEIICVNDCSPDNSLSILQEYAKEDNRIKIIDLKENGGLGHARNTALKEVTGKYVMFLDSDDWLELEACETAYKQINTYDNDFVFFNYYTYYESNGQKSWNDNKFRLLQTKKDSNQLNLNNLSEPFKCSSECWFKIYKTDFILKNNLSFLEKCDFEDRPFYMKAFVKAHSISVINQPLLNYRKRKNSITMNSKKWKDSVKSWKITKSELPQNASDAARQSLMLNQIGSLLYWFNVYTKMDKSIRKDFYQQAKEELLSYDINEVRKIRERIDFKTFKNITRSKDFKSFMFRQNFYKLFNITKQNNKIIIYFLWIKLVLQKKYKIKSNRITFIQGLKGYGCNLKYIAEKIIEEKLPYELVWLYNRNDKNINKKEFPKEIKLVKGKFINAYKYLSSSKVLIANARVPYFKKGFVKKSNQLYIQTWHGSVAFKKIEADIVHNEHMQNYLNKAKIDSDNINYLLTPSKFDTKKFSTNFFYNGPILEIGYPRNDIFFYDEAKKQKIIDKIRNKYNISPEQKIVIYAPTFRDSKDINIYKLNPIKVCTALEERFGNKWVFMTRLHPHIANKAEELSEIFPNAISASDYADMQELLLAADVFISDYTSSIWDFVLQKKPAFIYATDIEAYTYERDFYIPLQQMPFPIATNEAELVNCITNFDDKSYQKTLADFQKFRGIVDDGKASERTVEIIKKYIEEAQ